MNRVVSGLWEGSYEIPGLLIKIHHYCLAIRVDCRDKREAKNTVSHGIPQTLYVKKLSVLVTFLL